LPDSILWNGDKPRTDFVPGAVNIIIVICEASIITTLIYFINRLILNYDYTATNAKSIAFKTASITFGVILGIMIYGVIYYFIHG